jgi:hypothetical protein
MGLMGCIVTVLDHFTFNFNNVKHSAHKIGMYFVFTSHCMYVYRFHSAD